MLAERLMLLIYAYGTNWGIRSVTPGAHPHTEEELRYVRRRYLNAEVARMVAIEIANATFAARDAGLWGVGSTAVASDSTHFRAWDQNLFTEWHYQAMLEIGRAQRTIFVARYLRDRDLQRETRKA
ncbi:hypothetical protein GCM10010412_064270 [Nonomuraea recticatena]|uniref:Tn3 transposase DDE domain-containing protein n=1 Tax=Nonomuraea recticatena TaxID=46178 RepID=A0ABN3SLB2_9ACTN